MVGKRNSLNSQDKVVMFIVHLLLSRIPSTHLFLRDEASAESTTGEDERYSHARRGVKLSVLGLWSKQGVLSADIRLSDLPLTLPTELYPKAQRRRNIESHHLYTVQRTSLSET